MPFPVEHEHTWCKLILNPTLHLFLFKDYLQGINPNMQRKGKEMSSFNNTWFNNLGCIYTEN